MPPVNIRLSESRKSDLQWHVASTVHLWPDDPTRLAYEAALAEAQAAVLAEIDKEYPLADMRILRKYGVTTTHNSVKVVLALEDGKEYGKVSVPLSGERLFPKDAYVSHQARIVAYPGVLRDRTTTYAKALQALTAATESLRAPYYKVIRGSSSLKQVVEMWPEAACFFRTWGVQLPAVLSASERAAMAEDQERRSREGHAATMPAGLVVSPP